MLDALAERGYRLGVFTTATKRAAMLMLATTGLDAHFATVVCGDQVTEPKPSTDGLHLACCHLGVTVDEAAYVGDAGGGPSVRTCSRSRSPFMRPGTHRTSCWPGTMLSPADRLTSSVSSPKPTRTGDLIVGELVQPAHDDLIQPGVGAAATDRSAPCPSPHHDPDSDTRVCPQEVSTRVDERLLRVKKQLLADSTPCPEGSTTVPRTAAETWRWQPGKLPPAP